MTALQTAAGVDLVFIIVLALCGIFPLVKFIRGSIFSEKLADFCLSMILLSSATWIWFNHRVVVITVDGMNYKNIPETLFFYVILSSFVILIITKLITRKKKEKVKAPKEKE